MKHQERYVITFSLCQCEHGWFMNPGSRARGGDSESGEREGVAKSQPG